MKNNLPLGILIGLLMALMIAIVAGGAYYFISKRQAPKPEQPHKDTVYVETRTEATAEAQSADIPQGLEQADIPQGLEAPTVQQASKGRRYGLIKDEGGITNIRRGPGMDYAVADRINDGMFVLYENSGNGWSKVYGTNTDGTPPDFLGYVRNDKIVNPPRLSEHTCVAYVEEGGGYTNIRKGPGTSYDVVGRVKDGTFILVNQAFGVKWLRVYTQGGALRGYVSTDKVQIIEGPTF